MIRCGSTTWSQNIMIALTQLTTMSAASIVRIYDPTSLVTEASTRAILNGIFSKENGFMPGTFIIEIVRNYAGDTFSICVEWPPFPAHPDHPNPDAYRVAAEKIAEGICGIIRRIRPSRGFKKIQVCLSNFERTLGDLTSCLSVFAVEPA